MPDRVDYSEFYDRIHDLIETKAQGTLFTKCDKNHLIIVAVRDGKIISLRYGPKRGEAAIPLIRGIKFGDIRLDGSAIADQAQELPPTSVIMDQLKPDGPAKPFANGPMFDLSVPSAERQRGSVGEMDGAEVLCKLLAGFIGPVASLVCGENISAAGGLDSPEKVEVVIRGLAAEIPDSREAEEFIAQAHRLLQKREASPPPEAPSFDMQRAKSALCELLTDYLGPFAPIICDEKVVAMGDSADLGTIKAALEEIAGELQDRKEAEEFLARAWKRLQACQI